MMTLAATSPDGRALRIAASGRLAHEDYVAMIPVIERQIAEHGPLSVLADLTGLEGLEARAVLDDFVFGMRHLHDFRRLAVVGDKPWEAWLTSAAAHLTPAEMRYFDTGQAEEAWAWVCED